MVQAFGGRVEGEYRVGGQRSEGGIQYGGVWRGRGGRTGEDGRGWRRMIFVVVVV